MISLICICFEDILPWRPQPQSHSSSPNPSMRWLPDADNDAWNDLWIVVSTRSTDDEGNVDPTLTSLRKMYGNELKEIHLECLSPKDAKSMLSEVSDDIPTPNRVTVTV